MAIRKERRTAALILLAAASPAAVSAQAAQQRLQTEARVDALVSDHTAVHAGLGVSVPMGLYLRAGLVLGAGAGRHGFDGRSDLIARFSFDPLRQSRWAPYGGGGVSGRYNSTGEGGARGYLLVFAGVEGPLPHGKGAGWVPAIEVGLGGGARFGVAMRRGIHARR